MSNTGKWIRLIEERMEMIDNLKLYNINLPLDRFELEELKGMIEALQKLEAAETDDGK